MAEWARQGIENRSAALTEDRLAVSSNHCCRGINIQVVCVKELFQSSSLGSLLGAGFNLVLVGYGLHNFNGVSHAIGG
jgi:hypothetical protein